MLFVLLILPSHFLCSQRSQGPPDCCRCLCLFSSCRLNTVALFFVWVRWNLCFSPSLRLSLAPYRDDGSLGCWLSHEQICATQEHRTDIMLGRQTCFSSSRRTSVLLLLSWKINPLWKQSTCDRHTIYLKEHCRFGALCYETQRAGKGLWVRSMIKTQNQCLLDIDGDFIRGDYNSCSKLSRKHVNYNEVSHGG